jgi:hypothetical protein
MGAFFSGSPTLVQNAAELSGDYAAFFLPPSLPSCCPYQAFFGKKAHDRNGECGFVAVIEIEILLSHMRDELL